MSDRLVPTVTITRRGAQRIESGHVWVYRSDIQKADRIRGGSAVRVIDTRGVPYGTAFYSSQSQITLRLVSRQDRPIDELLEEHLRLAVDVRRRLFPNATGVRLVHGEADLLPGLVVDRYGDVLSIQTLTEATDQRKEWIVDRLVALTGATAVVERNDVSARRHEGLDMHRGLLRGQVDGPIEYREGDIRLTADVLEGQKTGAFLDQRENHVLAGDLAYGRALDCFSYHGGFALQLARKAETVVAVDSSEPAVRTLEDNARLNGLSNVETKVANAFDFLRAQVDAGERYDVIVLDPPAFTKSRDAIDAALRGYKEINLRALSMLRPGGLLVTASCSYHVDEQRFAQMVLDAAHDAKRSVQLLEKRGAGRDHPTLLGVPETSYLKCFFVRAI